MPGLQLQVFQDFFTKLTKKEKMIFYGAVVFIFLALLDRVIILPAFSKMKAQEDDIREKKMIIKKDLHIMALKDNIVTESEKYKSYFSQTKATDDEEVTSILREIESLANQSSVYLIYIRPGEITREGPFKNLVVSLNCEGDMPQLVQFLYLIEDSSKLLTIEKYAISPKTEGSSIAQCRMTVSKRIIP